MLATSDGVDAEPILEEEQLRLLESGENKRGGVEDVDQLSDGVVSRQVFRIRPGKRRGNGAVFRFLGNSIVSSGIGEGTNVTGFELGLALWKILELETGARTIGQRRTVCVGR